MAPTTAERGREVRRRLLGAAVELIPERGWTAVSTRAVADRAEVAAGLVHYHFPSVQALLREAAVGTMREAVASLGSVLEQARTPAESVELLLGSLRSYTGDDPVSALFVETHLAATRDPELRDAVAAVMAEFRARLGAWLGEHGVAEPEATAVVLGAAADGLVLQRALDPTLTAGTVAPVLVRMLTQVDTQQAGHS